MPTDHRAELANIKSFVQLIAYLRDEMGWPIGRDSFEDVDDLFYDFTAEELGIDPKTAAKITEIKRLKPLSTRQPWGIFFVKFEPKKLPVVALRRILSQVALKKRASANSADRTAWAADDLLFVSNYGEGNERQISFAHFAKARDDHDLPTLKVLGWDNRDTALHLDAVAKELTQHLAWPNNDADVEAWRKGWRSAFTLRHGEVVTTSKELSIRLAKLAGDIRDRIKSALAIETDRGPLTKLLKAFQTSLVHDLDADGFADMYAQTIAYGLLSARIADPTKKTVDDFAGHMRTNPFLRELMETFLKVGGRRGKAGGPGIDFDELGVSEVVQLLDDANMEAVVLDFGDKNPQEDPVIHFYELFLKEYDAKKRMQRGVFYTPRPVVSYIVRSVDELLRAEFGLEDGLADTATWGEMAKRHEDLKIPKGSPPDQAFVQILDPATGTGTFLVEVIDIIHKTMIAKWKAQGHGEKKIATLWNEYVPGHLLKRLHAYELLMAPYAIAHLKVGLKLYETGYRFGSDERARIYLTNALEPASDVGQQTLYWMFPALAHEAQAVNEVKGKQRFTVIIGNPPYQGFSANTGEHTTRSVDAYRYCDGKPLGERNPSWLLDDYVKFLRLGQQIVEHSGCGVLGMITNNGYVDNPTFRGMRESFLASFSRLRLLNLNGDSKKQLQSPNGSQDANVFAIQQGVAIGIFVREWGGASHCAEYSELWGAQEQKLAYLGGKQTSATTWKPVEPRLPFLLFRPTDADVDSEFRQFTSINDLFAAKGWGFKTRKDYLLVDFDREAVRERFSRIAQISPAAARKEFNIEESAYWSFEAAHRLIPKNPDKSIRPVLFRPFDVRYVFYEKYMIERGDHKFELMSQMFSPNIALITVRRNEGNRLFDHVFCTRLPAVLHSVSAKEANFFFPFVRYDLGAGVGSGGQERFFTLSEPEPNCKVHIAPSGDVSNFNYIYAVLFSNSYRTRYAEQLRIDFPRLPLIRDLELFRTLARLGNELTTLHLLESAKLDHPITEFIGGPNPAVEKSTWSKNTVWLDKAKTVGFKGVPEAVWNFHIGGYQVCEKWLKDRKGRMLSKDDIVHYQKIVVALNETIRLTQEIDVVIEQHGGWPGAFQTGQAQAAAPNVIPFRPRIVQPDPKARYVTCVPLVPLKAAAGAFSDPQHIDNDGFEWAAVETKRSLRPGMFVAQVVGKSMEPAIPDGAYCLFAAPVEGTRQGKTVLVQLRDATDPESGERYTVKRYESEKSQAGDSWRHEKITLKPVNPDFEPIVLFGTDEGDLHVVAEFIEVLGGEP